MAAAMKKAMQERMDDIALAADAAACLPALTDTQFVQTVRQRERLNPQWRDYRVWAGAVRQEIDLRLILKGIE
jgi:hypothetical protein